MGGIQILDASSLRRCKSSGEGLADGGRERGEGEGEGEVRAAVLVRRSMVTAVVAEDRSAREIGIGPGLGLYTRSRTRHLEYCLFFLESKLLTPLTSSSLSTPG